MRPAMRRLGLVLALVAAVAGCLLGLNRWWNQGEREDLAAWAETQRQISWLVASLAPESVGSNPPCVDSLESAFLSGKMLLKDSAQGPLIRDAESRLLREGWSASRKDTEFFRDIPELAFNDSFERIISGRSVTVTFVRSEQPTGLTISMDPNFCGL